LWQLRRLRHLQPYQRQWLRQCPQELRPHQCNCLWKEQPCRDQSNCLWREEQSQDQRRLLLLWLPRQKQRRTQLSRRPRFCCMQLSLKQLHSWRERLTQAAEEQRHVVAARREGHHEERYAQVCGLGHPGLQRLSRLTPLTARHPLEPLAVQRQRVARRAEPRWHQSQRQRQAL